MNAKWINLLDVSSVRVYNDTMKNKAAVALGRITSERKKRTSVENGRKASQIRARLTIYGHEDMSDKEFEFFKTWLTKVIPQTTKNKRGELSKVFRQTLYKTS